MDFIQKTLGRHKERILVVLAQDHLLDPSYGLRGKKEGRVDEAVSLFDVLHSGLQAGMVRRCLRLGREISGDSLHNQPFARGLPDQQGRGDSPRPADEQEGVALMAMVSPLLEQSRQEEDVRIFREVVETSKGKPQGSTKREMRITHALTEKVDQLPFLSR